MRRPFRRETLVPPAPAPADEAALDEITAMRARLEQLAALMGIDGAKLDAEPYDRAAALERTEGASPLASALHRIANAHGALVRAREAAESTRRSVLTLAWHMREARKVLAEAETAIDAAAMAVAAE